MNIYEIEEYLDGVVDPDYHGVEIDELYRVGNRAVFELRPYGKPNTTYIVTVTVEEVVA